MIFPPAPSTEAAEVQVPDLEKHLGTSDSMRPMPLSPEQPLRPGWPRRLHGRACVTREPPNPVTPRLSPATSRLNPTFYYVQEDSGCVYPAAHPSLCVPDAPQACHPLGTRPRPHLTASLAWARDSVFRSRQQPYHPIRVCLVSAQAVPASAETSGPHTAHGTGSGNP